MEAKGSWEINEINTTEKAIATLYYCHRCRHVVTVDVETSCPSCQGGFIHACGGVNSYYLTMSSESELSESGSDREGLVDEQRHVKRGSDEVNPSDSHLPPSGPHANANLATAEACVGSNRSEHVEIRVGDESNLNDSHLPPFGPHANTNLATAEACVGSNPSKHVEISVGDQHGESTVFVQARSIPRATSSDSEWNLLFTSFVIETLSFAFDLSSSPRKPQYTLIGMLLAIVAVLVCIWELVHKGKKEGVLLRRRGILWSFYYPPPKNKIFCPFPEIAGLSLAITQTICSGVQYHLYRRHVTCPIILDILTAILVFCSFVLLHIKLLRLVAYATLQNGT